MKRLEKKIRKNRHNYIQIQQVICQNGKGVYIYEQLDPDDESLILSYEVFTARIQKKDIVTPSEVIIPAGEKFAADREFGETAWSVGKSLEKAQKKLEEIIKHHGGRCEVSL